MINFNYLTRLTEDFSFRLAINYAGIKVDLRTIPNSSIAKNAKTIEEHSNKANNCVEQLDKKW